MRTFSIGVNNYWHTASIVLDEVPAPLYYLERFIEFICDIIPPIPLPPIPIKLSDKYDADWTDNKDGRTNLKDWYGDIQQLFHLYVCTNAHNLVWKYTESTVINLPYQFLKERFPDSFVDLEDEYTDDDDIEFRKETKKLADAAYHAFLPVHQLLGYEYKKAYLRHYFVKNVL
jgi:hypothetical protein